MDSQKQHSESDSKNYIIEEYPFLTSPQKGLSDDLTFEDLVWLPIFIFTTGFRPPPFNCLASQILILTWKTTKIYYNLIHLYFF